MKLLFLNVFTLFTLFSYAQKGSTKLVSEYEDTLKIIAKKIMNEETEEARENANKAFLEIFTEVLQYEKSFKYPFDSLKTVSNIFAPDNSFRIFTWQLKKKNNSYHYYGIIHYHNKNKKKYELIQLEDNSNNIRNVEKTKLDAKNWYGCIYYDIIHIKKKGRIFYTLLGLDMHNPYSTKKVIDIMQFSGKNKVEFGLPIFKNNQEQEIVREIMEYDAKTSISLRYEEKEKRIIFNNLVPARKDLEGLEEYYIPDGTFNAYVYKKDKWWLKEDVDIRNKANIIKSRKLKQGLIPK